MSQTDAGNQTLTLLNIANSGRSAKERVRIPEEERSRQNQPIVTPIKSRRIYMAEPIDDLSWAYMRLLREHSGMRKIYKEDPYAEVYRFRDNLYAILTESADGMGDSWMFLIDGPGKAMLIDTGFGIGNLPALIRAIVGDKELIVANTHGHYDHAYGNCWFDRVYCHEYEGPMLEGQDEHIWDYLFQDDGIPIWLDFDRADLPEFHRYEIVCVPDGYVWDLGDGYEIELIHLGGHTAGMAGFLDRKSKNFFCGDDFISMRAGIMGARSYLPYGEYATVSAFRNNVYRLNRRLDEVDRVFPGHFVIDLDNTVIPNMLSALDAVLADPLHNYHHCSVMGKKGMVYQRHIEGFGTIAYTEKSIGNIPPLTD